MTKYLTRKRVNDKKNTEKRNEVIIMLRYFQKQVGVKSLVYNSYTRIASFLNISPTTVRKVCINAIENEININKIIN